MLLLAQPFHLLLLLLLLLLYSLMRQAVQRSYCGRGLNKAHFCRQQQQQQCRSLAVSSNLPGGC
jgi:hypothetical protein